MNLKDLLVVKISALYDTENELIKALPKMAEAATSPDLKEAFEEHLMETNIHAERLEEVFSLLEVEPEKLKRDAIRGIVADGKWVIKNTAPEAALDVNLIRSAQYAEQHEIAGYRAAISWAETLDLPAVASLLQETLDEEMAANDTLDKIGEVLDQTIV